MDALKSVRDLSTLYAKPFKTVSEHVVWCFGLINSTVIAKIDFKLNRLWKIIPSINIIICGAFNIVQLTPFGNDRKIYSHRQHGDFQCWSYRAFQGFCRLYNGSNYSFLQDSASLPAEHQPMEAKLAKLLPQHEKQPEK